MKAGFSVTVSERALISRVNFRGSLTQPGSSVLTPGGVRILGWRNWPGRIAVAASSLYARNLLTFITLFWDKDAKAPKLPADDAIIQGTMLTRGGAVVHPQFQSPQAA